MYPRIHSTLLDSSWNSHLRIPFARHPRGRRVMLNSYYVYTASVRDDHGRRTTTNVLVPISVTDPIDYVKYKAAHTFGCPKQSIKGIKLIRTV